MHTESSAARATEAVCDALRRAIAGCRYAPGEFIRESRLAEELGVSRTPVREAFRRLDSEGWLEFEPNRGVRVRTWTCDDICELFDARQLIEPYLTRRAVERLDRPQRRQLAQLAEATCMHVDAADPPQLDAWFAGNRDFHDLLSANGGNARLATTLARLKQIPLIKWTFAVFPPEERQRSARQHLEIVAAAEARDGAWAEAVMRSHILSARASVLRRLAEREPT